MIGFPPYVRWAAIAPSDTAKLNAPCDAVYVGVAGTVTAIAPDGSSASFTAIAGACLPIQAAQIKATGTSATALVALYLAK